jgi:uncharacterized protein (TIGR02300 family)
MSARCEIDLSPGTIAVPFNGPPRAARSGREALGFFIALAIFSNEGGRNRRFVLGALTGPRDHGKPSALLTIYSCAGKITLIKPDLGTKRVCPSCAARFYDLQKRPIECPKCAFTFEPDALLRQRRPRTPDPAKETATEAKVANAEAAQNDDKKDAEDHADSEDKVIAGKAADDEEQDGGLGMSVSGGDDEDEDDDDEDDEDLVVDLDDDDDELDDELDDDLDDDEEDDTLLEEDEEEEEDVSTIIDADIETDES